MKMMNISILTTKNICDNLLGEVLEAVDVEVSINFINLRFQMEYLILFQKD